MSDIAHVQKGGSKQGKPVPVIMMVLADGQDLDSITVGSSASFTPRFWSNDLENYPDALTAEYADDSNTSPQAHFSCITRYVGYIPIMLSHVLIIGTSANMSIAGCIIMAPTLHTRLYEFI